jgi:hypothetical protein
VKKSKVLFEQTQEVIILPDLHIPFCNFKVVEAAYEFYVTRTLSGAKIKVIQIGDLTDQKAWSRFQKDPDDYSPELEWAHTMTQISLLKEYFPEMTIILGNHDRRIAMKSTEASLPQSLVRTLPEVFQAPGWSFHTSNTPFQFQGVTYIHGDIMAGAPIQKAHTIGTPLVQGHTHKLSLTYSPNFLTDIWAMEVGHALDPNSAAARYTAGNPNKGTQGFAHIDAQGNPHLYPVRNK